MFSIVMLVIGVIEHRGWCSPKGKGFVTTLVKNSCKTNIRPRSWDTYSKLNGGKNNIVGVFIMVKEIDKGKEAIIGI